MTHVDELASSGVIYVRHQIGDPIADIPTRRFGPKKEGGDGICLACRNQFAVGDYSVLVPIGPGDDPEAQEKAVNGRWFNAVAIEIHDTCAGAVFG